MPRSQLTDTEFALLQPLLPPQRRPGRAGRPFLPHRLVLEGIFWIHRTGAPWRDLPPEYGNWSTVYERFRRWRQSGLFGRILDALEAAGRKAEKSLEKQALGRLRGGLSTKIHVLCEGAGLPITVRLTPGQAHEATMLEPLLSDVRIGGKPGAPRQRFQTVSGDKGYDGAGSRQTIRDHGSTPLIPHRKRPDGSYPAEPGGFDKEQYKCRNVVERLIGKLKEFRRVATRYDKLA